MPVEVPHCRTGASQPGTAATRKELLIANCCLPLGTRHIPPQEFSSRNFGSTARGAQLEVGEEVSEKKYLKIVVPGDSFGRKFPA